MAQVRWIVGVILIAVGILMIRDAAYEVASAIRYRADHSRYSVVAVGSGEAVQIDRKYGTAWFIEDPPRTRKLRIPD